MTFPSAGSPTLTPRNRLARMPGMKKSPGRTGPQKTPGKEDWPEATLRVPAELRRQFTAIAHLAAVSLDGVIQLSLKHAAEQRGVDLPGWVAPPRQDPPRRARLPELDGKVWFRTPEAWDPVLAAWRGGEVRTTHGVIREAVRFFYNAGTPIEPHPLLTGTTFPIPSHRADAAAFWGANVAAEQPEAEAPHR